MGHSIFGEFGEEERRFRGEKVRSAKECGFQFWKGIIMCFLSLVSLLAGYELSGLPLEYCLRLIIFPFLFGFLLGFVAQWNLGKKWIIKISITSDGDA